jgi:magnesium transporter
MSPSGPESAETLTLDDLREAWGLLDVEDRLAGFRALERTEAEDFFLSLRSRDQAELLLVLPSVERRSWLRMLAPDDTADVIQEAPREEWPDLLALLDEPTRREVSALLAYAEDDAGGLMNPRFARVRPDMTIDEAIAYLRRQARERPESLYYAYVLDQEQRLLGVVSFRELFAALSNQKVADIVKSNLLLTVHEDMDQEEVAKLFDRHHLAALPVVDDTGVMKGIVTADDIVDVVREEATEDIQKIGGTEALDAPYLDVSFVSMIKKRAGWLMALFVGEMLTASAMSHYENEVARAVVLALFIPLVISSGGNSGSQATTLVIRAMALGEVKLRDWWRVVRREFFSGLVLGLLLAGIGVIRVLTWESIFHSYGPHAGALSLTVGIALVGVVMWGTVVGASLPFLLRRLNFDPASASAPFVATLVDVFGVVIYFTAAQLMLQGKLL